MSTNSSHASTRRLRESRARCERDGINAVMRAVFLDNGALEMRTVPLPARPPTGFALIRSADAILQHRSRTAARRYGFSGTPGTKVRRHRRAETKSLSVGALWVRSIWRAVIAPGARANWAVTVRRITVLGIVNQPGAFAEFLTLPEVNLRVVPDEITPQIAVFTEPVAAACEILDQVSIPPGSEVAVLGDLARPADRSGAAGERTQRTSVRAP